MSFFGCYTFNQFAGDSCRFGSQIVSSDTSSLAPEVTESEAAETGVIESPANGPAEMLVYENETDVTSNEQIAPSDTSSLVPEVSESGAVEMGDTESPENGPAEVLVLEIETANTENEPDRMRSPSAAQRGTKCLSEYYVLVICLFVKMVL